MKEETDRSESGDAGSGNVTGFKRILLHISGFFYWLLNLFNGLFIAQGQAPTNGGERQEQRLPRLTPNPLRQGDLIAAQ